MLPGKFIPVIENLANQCDQLGLTWALTGSQNLVMWGFDLKPLDIDLETDCYGAEQNDHLNTERVIWPLYLRELKVMQSWFARYDFESVQVEVMGGCSYRLPEGNQVDPRPLDKRIRQLVWQGSSLPLLNLADEQVICERMGRFEKAKRIRAWLVQDVEPTGINGVFND